MPDTGGVSVTELTADCANCVGLCCVALPFAASADFAIDKPAGQPCPHLQVDHRCGIHAQLRASGFRGCSAYDCFGAGQKISQHTFAGNDWRRSPDRAPVMFAALPIIQGLHELLWYLTDVRSHPAVRRLRDRLDQAADDIDQLSRAPARSLLGVDLDQCRRSTDAVLRQASHLVRAATAGARLDYQHADLAGADLRRQDLRAADLRGACLIAADLRGSDLSGIDLIGADMRDADLRGADLSGAIFCTRSQIAAARGDARTRLPPRLARPPHW